MADNKRYNLPEAFLSKDVLKRDNLFIKVKSHVEKINFENKKAKSV